MLTLASSLAARNLLLVREEPLKLVITDFGLSQLLPPGEKSVSAKAGSEIPFRWVDPSSVRQMKFTKKSDGMI
jgi:Protein tyrosine and serine/threonine kinase